MNREIKKDPKQRGMNWVNTVFAECQFCGETWHKHHLWCPNYDSIAPKRCAVKHTPFLRSIDRGRGPSEQYEYECSLCNMPSVFSTERPLKSADPHPFCRVSPPRHYWATCGDGCCEPWCNGCGIKGTWDDLRKQVEAEQ